MISKSIPPSLVSASNRPWRMSHLEKGMSDTDRIFSVNPLTVQIKILITDLGTFPYRNNFKKCDQRSKQFIGDHFINSPNLFS